MKCLHRTCQKQATVRISAPYDEDWFGCNDHWEAMEACFHFGRPDQYEVRVTRLRQSKPRFRSEKGTA